MNQKLKILAVIPARMGSKGIPNKNIRIIGGRPLIYYAIKNALNSEKITGCIVTTDSPEIMLLAKQLGVEAKMRSKELCGDAVTLDAVVFDAVKELECDYVVTMQSTSPTLTTETLDKAIEFAVRQNLDTCISVINRPHLTWREENGNILPNYEKRLNRQYLPVNYVETGAFVISKREVVTESSRIGEKVGVYEIGEPEAVDIDNFYDLRIAEAIIQNHKIAIYVNGNNKRGMGHVYRALEIADEFFVKPDIYYDVNQSDRMIFGETTHSLQPVDSIGALFSIIEKKQYSIFINDILSTSLDYMIALRKALPNATIINFEDDGEGIFQADLVINDLYAYSNVPHVKAGEKYYISPKLFMFYEPIKIRPMVEKVFICFGGADPQDYSARTLRIIQKEKYSGYKFLIIVGRAKGNVEDLLRQSEKNIEILYDVKNMPELMSYCDIAITSRGRTGYELAQLGIPTIAMAQNEREMKHGFVCNENGFTYLGMNPSEYIFESTLDMYLEMSQDDRQKIQNKLLSHDLRGGRKRVMGLIKSLIGYEI